MSEAKPNFLIEFSKCIYCPQIQVSGIKQIIANDLSSSAVKSIQENIRLNNVENLITASEANATTLMYNSTDLQNRFDVIDLGKIALCFSILREFI